MGFVLPRVFGCCLCITLRIGCIIIGYFSLVFAALFISLSSLSFVIVSRYVQNYNVSNTNNTEHSLQEVQKDAIKLYIIHGYYIAVLTYSVVLSILLLIGAHRRTPRLLRWYFKAGLALLLMAISMVIVSYVFFGIIGTIPMLIWSVLVFYFLVVARSTYLDIEEADKTPPIEMNRLFIGQAYT